MQAITGYQLRDNRTKCYIDNCGTSGKHALRDKADRLNRQYGAHRYSVEPIYYTLTQADMAEMGLI